MMNSPSFLHPSFQYGYSDYSSPSSSSQLTGRESSAPSSDWSTESFEVDAGIDWTHDGPWEGFKQEDHLTWGPILPSNGYPIAACVSPHAYVFMAPSMPHGDMSDIATTNPVGLLGLPSEVESFSRASLTSAGSDFPSRPSTLRGSSISYASSPYSYESSDALVEAVTTLKSESHDHQPLANSRSSTLNTRAGRRQKARKRESPHVVKVIPKSVFGCSYSDCKKTFRGKEHLKRHERGHYSKKGRPCQLNLCGTACKLKHFTRDDNQVQHYATHIHNDKGKNKTFSKDFVFYVIKRTETPERADSLIKSLLLRMEKGQTVQGKVNEQAQSQHELFLDYLAAMDARQMASSMQSRPAFLSKL